jgi:hypothetical protein
VRAFARCAMHRCQEQSGRNNVDREPSAAIRRRPGRDLSRCVSVIPTWAEPSGGGLVGLFAVTLTPDLGPPDHNPGAPACPASAARTHSIGAGATQRGLGVSRRRVR